MMRFERTKYGMFNSMVNVWGMNDICHMRAGLYEYEVWGPKPVFYVMSVWE